jgi:putative membrane protein
MGMADPRKIEKSASKLKDSAVSIRDSATHMGRDTARMEVKADRRTELAADRTLFAAERTYAAWVRTGLVALASGVGAKSLLEPVLGHWLILATGSVLVLFSAFCFGAAVWRQLYPGPPPPLPDARRLPPAVLIAVNAFLVLVALAVLVGIWLGQPAAI